MANLEGITVTIYRVTGTGDDESTSYVGSTTTASDGTYTLDGLSAGTYRLKFSDSDGNYCTEYYNGKTTLDDATDIVVGSDEDVAGKDVVLDSASTVSGTVTG